MAGFRMHEYIQKYGAESLQGPLENEEQHLFV